MANVEKITIALTSEMASFIRRSVDAGQYASSSEAIREAVREWQERKELLFGYSIEDLRALVQEGIDSGPSIPADEVFAGIREKVRAQLPGHS